MADKKLKRPRIKAKPNQLVFSTNIDKKPKNKTINPPKK